MHERRLPGPNRAWGEGIFCRYIWFGRTFSGWVFHGVENFFPWRGKIAKKFSMAWKTGGGGNVRRVAAPGGGQQKAPAAGAAGAGTGAI